MTSVQIRMTESNSDYIEINPIGDGDVEIYTNEGHAVTDLVINRDQVLKLVSALLAATTHEE